MAQLGSEGATSGFQLQRSIREAKMTSCPTQLARWPGFVTDKHEQNINSTCPAETKCLPVGEVVALSECEIYLRHALREVDKLCLCQGGPCYAIGRPGSCCKTHTPSPQILPGTADPPCQAMLWCRTRLERVHVCDSNSMTRGTDHLNEVPLHGVLVSIVPQCPPNLQWRSR